MAAIKSTRAFSSFICHSCRQRILPAVSKRAFSTSPKAMALDDTFGSPSFLGGMGGNRSRGGNRQPSGTNTKDIESILDAEPGDYMRAGLSPDITGENRDQPYRLHVYATKHNTHLTFVQPSRPASQTTSSSVSSTSSSAKDQNKMVDVLLSLSTGNIGFRKAGRGSYDAAFQLAAFTLKQMQEKGMLRDMHSLQVVLRGFGAGREAVTKVILGTEGRFIRSKITSVVDATRLKQGGPRSKKPRRLG